DWLLIKVPLATRPGGTGILPVSEPLHWRDASGTVLGRMVNQVPLGKRDLLGASMTTLETWFERNRPRCEADLVQLLRIPSVSADSRHRADVRRAAGWLREEFRRLGFTVDLVETAGHPIVYAESPRVPAAPTALV